MYNDEFSEYQDEIIKEEVMDELTSTPTIGLKIPKIEPLVSDDYMISTSTDEPGLASPIRFALPYKLKDPVILLEKCDKIWETLKLIKNVQLPTSSSALNIPQTTQDEFGISQTYSLKLNPSSCSAYVNYQPVLDNGNTSLPNFKFSIKNREELFHCTICGKQYTTIRCLRDHSEKTHEIVIPPRRRKKRYSSYSNNKQLRHNELKDLNKPLVKSKVLQKKCAHESTSQYLQETEMQSEDLLNSFNIKSLSQQGDYCNSSLCKDKTKYNNIECTESVNTSSTIYKQSVTESWKHTVDAHNSGSSNIVMRNNLVEHINSMVDLNSSLSYNTLSSNIMRTKKNFLQKHTEKYNLQSLRNNIGKRKRKPLHDCYRKRHKPSYTASQNPQDKFTYSRTGKYLCDTNAYQHNVCLQNLKSYKDVDQTCREIKENLIVNGLKGIETQKKSIKANNNLRDSSRYDNLSNMDYNVQQNKESSENETEPIVKLNNEHQKECICGRLFRDPYTLFTHRQKCEGQKPTTVCGEDSETFSNNTDSGIDLSIIIKKKNRSYEIDGNKGCNNDDKSVHFQDLSCTDYDWSINKHLCFTKYSKCEQLKDTDYTKYSKCHTILRLQDLDVDVDVDVETVVLQDSYKEKEDSTFLKTELPLEEKTNKDENNYTHKQESKATDKAPGIMQISRKHCVRPRRRNRKRTLNNYICVCGLNFTHARGFARHMVKVHASLLICAYCKERFEYLDKDNSHECNVNKGGTFVEKPKILCPSCKSKFPDLAQFDEHIKLEHFDGKLLYSCYKCTRRFATNDIRNVHISEQHRETVCKICYKTISCNYELKHEAYHYGLGYPCHICKRAYTQNATLWKHMCDFHNAEGPQATCPVCSKSMKRQSLRGHLRKVHKQV